MKTDGIKPLPGIPKVRVLDENGKEILRGYYVHHVNRQTCVIGDELSDEDVDHLVLRDGFADWNMPKSLIPTKVTPPHTIEIIEEGTS